MLYKNITNKKLSFCKITLMYAINLIQLNTSGLLVRKVYEKSYHLSKLIQYIYIYIYIYSN